MARTGRMVRWIAAGGATGAALVAPALADDVAAFLAGTAKTCIQCNLAGQDLKDREFKRVKLDRAVLKNADLTDATLFRSSLQRWRRYEAELAPLLHELAPSLHTRVAGA